MMKGAYENSVVVVTGASSGLGRAIACGAAQAGARVVVVNYANNKSQAEVTAERVVQLGAQAVVVQGNIAEDSDCRKIVEAAEPFGCIDALFNNAAVSRKADFDSFTADDFLFDYRVNVVGAFQMVRAARPLLEAASSRGAIVNVSSIAAVDGFGSSPSYTASKGALVTLGKWLARELAPAIRVNTVCPGFIDTEWFDKQPPPGGVDRLREFVRNSNALNIVSKPEDVADVALFLGSSASRHMTGETLNISGGPTVRKAN